MADNLEQLCQQSTAYSLATGMFAADAHLCQPGRADETRPGRWPELQLCREGLLPGFLQGLAIAGLAARDCGPCQGGSPLTALKNWPPPAKLPHHPDRRDLRGLGCFVSLDGGAEMTSGQPLCCGFQLEFGLSVQSF